LGALASDIMRHELWRELIADLEIYKQGVINELMKHSESLMADNEKRAMIFAFNRVIEYPHRLIENGQRARRALEEATKAASLHAFESRAQAVETLGYHQAID
jgi:hypothetical protein